MWLFSRTNFVGGPFSVSACQTIWIALPPPSSPPLLHSNCHSPKSRKKGKENVLGGKRGGETEGQISPSKTQNSPSSSSTVARGGLFFCLFLSLCSITPKRRETYQRFSIPFYVGKRLFWWREEEKEEPQTNFRVKVLLL